MTQNSIIIALLLLVISLISFGITDNRFYKKSFQNENYKESIGKTIADCEKELPRNKKCVIAFTPKVVDVSQ